MNFSTNVPASEKSNPLINLLFSISILAESFRPFDGLIPPSSLGLIISIFQSALIDAPR